MDTIFALASGRGKAGVSVIRVSGPRAFDICAELAGDVPERRVATLRVLHDHAGDVIDQALVLSFSKDASFTGEEVVEFQTHGSAAVVAKLLNELSAMPGLRSAEAGEFTRRALENNRMDLAEIEGLGDLIEAETEAQRRQALDLFSGRLSEKVELWRSKLISAMGLLEATIDFVDEDVPVDVTPEVLLLLHDVSDDLEREIAGVRWAERVRDGFKVAIVGAPNTGKSTLLNYLAGRDVAITSEIAGTTRDVIEVRMDIDGYPVSFFDTAGLRDTSDPVERAGITRTEKVASDADLRVFLGDVPNGVSLGNADVKLVPKDDLGTYKGISGKTGAGVAELLSNISSAVDRYAQNVGSASRPRHLVALNEGKTCLLAAIDRVGEGPERIELAAEELRTCVSSLERLVGRVGVEDVLDEIFLRFCIGK